MKTFAPIQQEFQVGYRYPVHFTTEVFRPGNPRFAEAIRADGGHFPGRCSLWWTGAPTATTRSS